MTKAEPAQPIDLQRTIEQRHDCSARFVSAVYVFEEFEGTPAWEGVVHVFDITGHTTASRAYAWSSPIEGSSKRRFFAVLHVPAVTSRIDAVRAAIVAEHRAICAG